VHSVKGGEADDVILFPDLSPAGYSEYMSTENRDRILRLFYVGMTRAKDRLVLCERSAPRAVDWI
jgi:ATP-dependent exoDNAse (exonuclease V) beta subunit